MCRNSASTPSCPAASVSTGCELRRAGICTRSSAVERAEPSVWRDEGGSRARLRRGSCWPCATGVCRARREDPDELERHGRLLAWRPQRARSIARLRGLRARASSSCAALAGSTAAAWPCTRTAATLSRLSDDHRLLAGDCSSCCRRVGTCWLRLGDRPRRSAAADFEDRRRPASSHATITRR